METFVPTLDAPLEWLVLCCIKGARHQIQMPANSLPPMAEASSSTGHESIHLLLTYHGEKLIVTLVSSLILRHLGEKKILTYSPSSPLTEHTFKYKSSGSEQKRNNP